MIDTQIILRDEIRKVMFNYGWECAMDNLNTYRCKRIDHIYMMFRQAMDNTRIYKHVRIDCDIIAIQLGQNTKHISISDPELMDKLSELLNE